MKFWCFWLYAFHYSNFTFILFDLSLNWLQGSWIYNFGKVVFTIFTIADYRSPECFMKFSKLSVIVLALQSWIMYMSIIIIIIWHSVQPLHPKFQQLYIDFTLLPIMVVFSHPLKVTLMDAGAKIIFWVNSTYFTRAAAAAKQ